MNIVLTGFMATGKTQISKRIANMLGYNLVDTDAVIVERTNMSINEIFDQNGEEYFREIEHDVICDVGKLDNTVISTGGGVVLNQKNIKELRKNGIIVNLSPDFDVILERLSHAKDSRPLLKDSDIEGIHQRFIDRLPYYAVCDYKIKVSNEYGPEHFAKEIVKLIQPWMSFKI